VLSEEARNPYLRADSLAELTSWHDVDFVRCAYVTVLGRQPDPQGEAYYTHRIRQGHSKLEILWQLRKSPEARRHDPGIAGFDRTLRKGRWDRGWLGWIIRPFSGGEGDSPAWRRHRMLINELGRANRPGSLAASSAVVADLHNLAAQLGGLSDAIARLSSGSAIAASATSSHAQLLDNPDYRRLSVSSQNIFRRVHAHSH